MDHWMVTNGLMHCSDWDVALTQRYTKYHKVTNLHYCSCKLWPTKLVRHISNKFMLQNEDKDEKKVTTPFKFQSTINQQIQLFCYFCVHPKRIK